MLRYTLLAALDHRDGDDVGLSEPTKGMFLCCAPPHAVAEIANDARRRVLNHLRGGFSLERLVTLGEVDAKEDKSDVVGKLYAHFLRVAVTSSSLPIGAICTNSKT